MKHLTFYTLLIPLVAMAACMCKPPSGPVENPFDNDGEAALKVNVTSRADTVRLDWELLSKKEFDTYRIEVKDLGIGLSVPALASLFSSGSPGPAQDRPVMAVVSDELQYVNFI